MHPDPNSNQCDIIKHVLFTLHWERAEQPREFGSIVPSALSRRPNQFQQTKTERHNFTENCGDVTFGTIHFNLTSSEYNLMFLLLYYCDKAFTTV